MAKSPFKVRTEGSFKKFLMFLKRLENGEFYKILDHYGQLGVEALRDRTPVYTGRAASSWFYEVDIDDKQASITWCNSDIEHGSNVIMLLEYGHGTRRGGYIDGIDIVDPALEPVLTQMIDDVWKEVERL